MNSIIYCLKNENNSHFCTNLYILLTEGEKEYKVRHTITSHKKCIFLATHSQTQPSYIKKTTTKNNLQLKYNLQSGKKILFKLLIKFILFKYRWIPGAKF